MEFLSYFYIFLQSNALELPVYWLAYRAVMGFTQSASAATLANMITHPVVFFVFMGMERSYIESILAAEAFAIVVETLLHKYTFTRISWTNVFCASLFANLCSWQVAPLLTYHFFLR